MHSEGWRRLWELTKWLATLAVSAWIFISALPSEVPAPNASPSAGQIMIVVLFMSGLAGGATFGLLHALEWVYRGFRPLPVSPTEEAQPEPQTEPSDTPPTTAEALEHHPALPHPNSQQMNERQR